MNKTTKTILISCATLVLIISFVNAGRKWIITNKQLKTVEPFVLEIKEGESIESIAKRLQETGMVVNAGFFKYYLQYTKQDKLIQAGYYMISQQEDHLKNLDDLITILQEGKAKLTKYMIPEGYTIRKIAKKLSEEGLVNEQRFIELATRNGGTFTFPYLDQVKDGNLEGFLFPDTYFISNPTEEKIIQQMLDQFSDQISKHLQEKLPKQSLSLREVIILASIVEREAQKDEERPVIASVFLNRLHDGWKLEACSTVEYVVLKEAYVLSLDELQVDSPYNTYKYAGLPIGPISNPGLQSILAVLEPAKTKYFFFAAKGDGTHAFAVTLEEHNRNVAKYIP